LSYASRLLSATLSTATVPLAWQIARGALGVVPGLIAALLFAANVASIQSAHFGTTESTLNFLEMLVALVSALYISRTISFERMALVCAFFIGQGLAIKTSALTLAVMPFVASVTSFRELGALRVAGAAFLSAVVCIALFAVLSPHSVLFLTSFRDAMLFEKKVVTGDADVFWTWQFFGKPNYVFPLSQFAWLCNPITAGLGLAGVAIIAYKGVVRRLFSAQYLLPLVAFVIIEFAIIGGWHAKFVRYLMPCVPGVLLGAVFIIGRAYQEQRLLLFRITTMVVLGSSLLWAAAYMSIYLHEDSRIAASRWLLDQITDAQLILREPHDNPLPLPVLSGIRFQTRYLNLFEENPQKSASALASDLAHGDWLIIASRRYIGTLPRLQWRFPLACFYYRALFDDEIGYQLVGTFANEPAIFGITIPTRFAEETFQVFDHPTVLVFRNVARKSETAIKSQLLADFEKGDCSFQSTDARP
jgi:hypothetical protein